MPDTSIAARVARIQAIADIYASVSGTDRQDIATDLLTDVLHWCARHNIDAEQVLARARMHVAAELDEAARRH
ncbi:hypothetical protein [Teichococcus vastitatis]|uniref:hypothetical protein n=1 Tax=Teichococcus vastitatis TaxID=2307076 RepID=UPI000E77148B|nr:hypothetical protein [Pseudoroseomonas vastitatis]